MIKKSIRLILAEISQMFDSESVKIGLTQLDLRPARRIRKYPPHLPARKFVRRKQNSVPDNFFSMPNFYNSQLKTSIAN